MHSYENILNSSWIRLHVLLWKRQEGYLVMYLLNAQSHVLAFILHGRLCIIYRPYYMQISVRPFRFMGLQCQRFWFQRHIVPHYDG